MDPSELEEEEEEEGEGGEGEEGEEGGEGVELEPEKEFEDNALSADVAGESLSLLCKTGTGLAHAYVRIDLKDKQLTDVAILNCFVHLRYLDISGNRLKDISAVNGLPHLLTIDASKNLLTSAKMEEFQYLQVANFSHNKIASTEGLAHPLLEKLILSFNKISTLVGLKSENLPSLKLLDLHGNQLTSTAGIELAGLQVLYLASNRLSELAGLGMLGQLTTLHLRANRLASCSDFSPSMEALQYLNLRENTVSELSEIKKLSCLPLLRALILAECPVAELDDYRLEVLVALRKLERLDKDEFTEDEMTDAEDVFKQREMAGNEEAEEPED